jgi:glycosyltransferase involved in cell wall biosynthesis
VKILLVAARYPWPPRRGDQLRAVQAFSALAPDHEVTLLVPRPPAKAPPPPAGVRVELYEPGGAFASAAGVARAALSGWPLQTGLFVSADLHARIRNLAPQADLGILPLARLARYADDFGDLPLVVDLIDSLALNLERRAEVDPWLRPLLRAEAKRLLRAETALATRAQRTLVVSERDRAYLAERLGPAVAARLQVVGIAVESWVGKGSSPAEVAADPYLAFTGNLGYFVNADAARWLLTEVWPELHRRRPGLRLLLAGDRPGRALRRLAASSPGVELIASPPELFSILAGATLALAPLRCGSGVPIKVLEAWAAGVPVVASPWAAAGTPGVAGEDFAVAAEDPRLWVAAIERLLDDVAARQRLAAAGRSRLAETASPAAIARQWRAAVALP